MNVKRTAPQGEPAEPDEDALHEVLGYLNFSGGKPDPAFLRSWNRLFAHPSVASESGSLAGFLRDRLERLKSSAPAFADCSQATAVLNILFEHALPAYREHHRDLLFNLSDSDLYQPFFLARMIEGILQQG